MPFKRCVMHGHRAGHSKPFEPHNGEMYWISLVGRPVAKNPEQHFSKCRYSKRKICMTFMPYGESADLTKFSIFPVG